jgi:ATP-binding cassette subfamily B protein
MVQAIGRWRATVTNFLHSLGQMVKLAWDIYPLGLLTIIALDILQGLVPLGTAWITKLLFDQLALVLEIGLPVGSASASSATSLSLPQNILLLLIAQVILTILSQSLSPVTGYFNVELGRKISLSVQTKVFTKISNLTGLAYFEDPKFYDTIQLAARGAQRGPSQAVHILTVLLRSTITLLSFLGLLISFSPTLAAIVFLGSLPHLYTHMKVGRERLVTAMDSSPIERETSYYGNLLSALPFAKEVRLFGLADHFIRIFSQLSRAVHKIQRRQQVREVRSQVMLLGLSSLVAGVAFAIVILLALQQHLSLGDIMLYTSAVSSIQAALTSLLYALGNAHESVLFYTHFSKLLSLPASSNATGPRRTAPPLKSAIEFRNVSFRYSEQHPWVLRNVDLCIPAGQCLALVGLNGAGKTTLVKLVTRLYDPTEGEILWDGIDLREFDPHELRQRIAAILQDFVRYDVTAHDNIGLGNVSKLEDRDSVRSAAMKAGIHDRLEELPLGYQTVLSRWLAGDSPGVDLSGGEWQKIALARMLVRASSTDLLILDEPTAALDAQAEYDLYTRFVELVGERTSLLITHRFSTVRMADLVAVIEDGSIKEYGTHEELLSLDGIYARLYSMQAERYR